MESRPLRSCVVSLVLGAMVVTPAVAQSPAPAPPRQLSDAECQTMRERLAGHARLSEGVRRAVAARAAANPAPPAPVAAPAPAPAAPAVAAATPANRGAEIRARLARIPVERQQAEDGRLGAMARFDLGRAAQYQTQLSALEAERMRLEQELAALPTAPATPAPATPAPAPMPPPAPAPARPASDADRVRCTEMIAASDEAIRIRQKELGAKEGQAGVVPLLPPVGQNAADVAKEMAAQMPEGPGAQVGLLDADGDGRVEAFVDVPARGVYRLYRQRPDGTLSVEVFSSATAATPPPYGEIPRRIDEAAARQLGRSLADLLSVRPTGAVRVTAETPDFAAANAQWLAGGYGEVAKLERPAARTMEYQNLRGEMVRVTELLSPVTNGLVQRQLVATPRPPDQEQWEETIITVRPVSMWRTEVDLLAGRETHGAGGALIGARSSTAPVKFGIDR